MSFKRVGSRAEHVRNKQLLNNNLSGTERNNQFNLFGCILCIDSEYLY